MVQGFLADADREYFLILTLSTKNSIMGVNVVSIGSLNSSLVHPREVFKLAILSNAAAVILVHNHPSGDPTFSNEDMEITRRLVEASKIIGIEILDHVVVGDGCWVSFKEKGEPLAQTISRKGEWGGLEACPAEMSWGSYASIEIPKRYLTPEVLEIVKDYVTHKDDLPDKNTVQFYSDNAANGRFEDLEAELIGLNIPFDRYTGQDFDIDPRPGITGRRRTVARRSMSPSLSTGNTASLSRSARSGALSS